MTNNVLSFSDFIDIVSKELMRENMKAAITEADMCGISSMSMEDKKGYRVTVAPEALESISGLSAT